MDASQLEAWPYIEDLNAGDRFDSCFAIRSNELRHTREGKPYLILDLSDRTGHIKAKLWDDADTYHRAMPPDTIVKVQATAEEYLGNLELKLHMIRPVSDTDLYEQDRFIPRGESDPEADWQTIREAVSIVVHPGIRKLLDGLLADETFVSKFTLMPGGKQWHHAYLGGLLEHAASMLSLVQPLCDNYPKLNRDLLIAGAILHDVGKLWELRHGTTIDYTPRGRLQGHIVLGAQFLHNQMKDIEELDSNTKMQLEHLILSHQGSREYGSPTEPMTREAFVLYYLDEIDSKLNAIDRILAKHMKSGSKDQFTSWVNLLGRKLYSNPNAPSE